MLPHLFTNKKYYDENQQNFEKNYPYPRPIQNKKIKLENLHKLSIKFSPIVRPDICRIHVLCAHFQILCIAFSSIVIADFKSNFKIQMQILLFILDICWIS